MIPENHRQPNRLIHATSPYLLQHAHNPVDWFEWGKEALTRATRERKPILVSIGYSSCHWCHVMERESFEVPDIAHIMNEHFVCIKVDREERPDIDHLYMEAVQAMGVNGGWPLNVFLTPDQKPFYGGTYFPPTNWARLLQQIARTFREQPQEIESSASQLSEQLNISDLQRFRQDQEGTSVSRDDLDAMFQILQERFDNVWGGMARAPKFVMPTIWMFLLRYYFITRNKSALDMVILTLTRMSEGGLYDQLGGGFSRYSVDKEWFAPHFEKMLYDNAQLLSLYSEAYAITQNPIFRKVVFETVEWLRREMLHPSGGFYSALDADSEGIEGQYYTWTQDELNNLLGEKAKPFSQLFQTTPNGNWEHGRNILRRHRDNSQEEDIAAEKEILFHTRLKRIPPLLDDKILTGWNAMMIKGLLDAHNVFEEPAFLELARNAMVFLEKSLCENKKYYRSFRNSRSPTEGFLEDYAMLIQACIALYQSTFEEVWLTRASALTEYCLENFFDKQEGYFHFSGKSGEQLIAGKKEIFDNVIPSSNSVMAGNLYHLGILLDRQDWKQLATHMVTQLRSIVRSEPGYLSNWGILMTEMIYGISEVVIVGPRVRETRSALGRSYAPFAVRLGTETKSALPLLEGRDATDEKTRIYVCFEKTCKLPVETVNEALKQLGVN